MDLAEESRIRNHRSVSVASADVPDELGALRSSAASQTTVESGSIKHTRERRFHLRRLLSRSSSTRSANMTESGPPPPMAPRSQSEGGSSSLRPSPAPSLGPGGVFDIKESRLRMIIKQQRESQGLRELAEFFRNHTPPPSNLMSVDDDGSASSASSTECTKSGGHWSAALKAIILRRKATKSKRRSQLQLPDSAVAGRTMGGHRHISISIPYEHSHLGPELKSQYPVYGPGGAIVSSPSSRVSEIETQQGPIRPWLPERGLVTVLRPVAELKESVESLRQGLGQSPTKSPSRSGSCTGNYTGRSLLEPSSKYFTKSGMLRSSSLSPSPSLSRPAPDEAGEDANGRMSAAATVATMNEWYTAPNSPASAPISPPISPLDLSFVPPQPGDSRGEPIPGSTGKDKGMGIGVGAEPGTGPDAEPSSIDDVIRRDSPISERHNASSSAATDPGDERNENIRHSMVSIADSIVTDGSEPVIVTDVRTVRRISSSTSFVQKHSALVTPLAPAPPLPTSFTPLGTPLTPSISSKDGGNEEESTAPAPLIKAKDKRRRLRHFTGDIRNTSQPAESLVPPPDEEAPRSPISERTIRPWTLQPSEGTGTGRTTSLLSALAAAEDAVFAVKSTISSSFTFTPIMVVNSVEPSNPSHQQPSPSSGSDTQTPTPRAVSRQSFHLRPAPRPTRAASTKPQQEPQQQQPDNEHRAEANLEAPSSEPTPPGSPRPSTPPPKPAYPKPKSTANTCPATAKEVAKAAAAALPQLDRISLTRRIERRKKLAAAMAEAQQARVFASLTAEREASKEKQEKQDFQDKRLGVDDRIPTRTQSLNHHRHRYRHSTSPTSPFFSSKGRGAAADRTNDSPERLVEDMELRVRLLERSGEAWLASLAPLLDSLNRTLAEQDLSSSSSSSGIVGIKNNIPHKRSFSAATTLGNGEGLSRLHSYGSSYQGQQVRLDDYDEVCGDGMVEKDAARTAEDPKKQLERLRSQRHNSQSRQQREDSHASEDEEEDDGVVVSLRERIPAAPKGYYRVVDDVSDNNTGSDDNTWLYAANSRRRVARTTTTAATTGVTNTHHRSRGNTTDSTSTGTDTATATDPKRPSSLLREFEEELSRRLSTRSRGPLSAADRQRRPSEILASALNSNNHPARPPSAPLRRPPSSSASSYHSTASHSHSQPHSHHYRPSRHSRSHLDLLHSGRDSSGGGIRSRRPSTSAGTTTGAGTAGENYYYPVADGFNTLAPLMNELCGTARVSMEAERGGGRSAGGGDGYYSGGDDSDEDDDVDWADGVFAHF